jgi:hypothetical protein
MQAFVPQDAQVKMLPSMPVEWIWPDEQARHQWKFAGVENVRFGREAVDRKGERGSLRSSLHTARVMNVS